MTATQTPAAKVSRRSIARLLPPDALFAFLAAVVAILVIGVATLNSQRSRSHSAAQVTASFTALSQLEMLLSELKDAETAQRGFLLTRDESYLQPYETARTQLPEQYRRLQALFDDQPAQRQQLDAVQVVAAGKMAELEQTIAAIRSGDEAGALASLRTNRGKFAMDRLRKMIGDMSAAERGTLAQRQGEWEHAVDVAVAVTWGGSALLLILVVVAAVFASRNFRQRETETWLRKGQIGLSEHTTGDPSLQTLGERILPFVAAYLDAQVGAIYIAEHGIGFRSFATYATSAETATIVRPSDGLLGQVILTKQSMRVRDLPENYLDVRSSLGSSGSRELLIAPAVADGVVQAVIELGFFREVDAADEQFLQRASEILAIAVRSARDRSRLEELLEETQRQAEELQAQQEELRVNNEELEEQGRVLKESQAQLESQQAELEQTNFQLSEQAQLLEDQRDHLARGQKSLTEKADELMRANRYKSEFLANMSHELRTPLNSTLILAKLLADNKHGNLTSEQVKFADTISSAGNDLLALINDILDLSKIESGKVEVNIEPVQLQGTVDSLARTFDPMAREKRLAFATSIDAGAPRSITTDPQRLEQILRNLVSNAIKFTESGSVALAVGANGDDRIAFVVRDTGIGIAAEQQDFIFEAFRQADGSTHRKYGGTGLGLSISRDLARLLGGDIVLHSEPGRGSTFTLTLPVAHAVRDGIRSTPIESHVATAMKAIDSRTEERRIASGQASGHGATISNADDRAQLRPDARLILVIEDDLRFAAILQDLAHEMGFQCVHAGTANDGLAAAAHFKPSAILLDMNLPDHSGLGVLDQLKHNPATRHIPVHVMSVADFAHEALEMGAIGYALKPVKREQIIEALQLLENKFSQQMQRVLVIEDDPRQRDSLGRLLGNPDVSIVPVVNAAQALEQLAKNTFDCVVMDLNLPDMSGLELLETMASHEDIAFPPVIVYTGRSLTPQEEQALRRYSRSIIIKDAHSPERLLDEVTLFLHQVESKLPTESQRMLQTARDRDAALENRRILVVEDDVRNVFAVSSVLEPKGVKVEIARNGREALEALERSLRPGAPAIDLVLMDIMMPEMDGFTAMREIRKRAEWARLPIIALTAKAMKDDQEKCIAAGANDYIAKPLHVEKLLSLVRVWMPKK